LSETFDVENFATAHRPSANVTAVTADMRAWHVHAVYSRRRLPTLGVQLRIQRDGRLGVRDIVARSVWAHDATRRR